jgi:hypothetical protein
LGYGYDYWNSNWYPYNYGPDYPGQFVQGGADQSTAAESAGAPSSVDTLSPTPTTAASVPDSALLASPQWRDADAQVRIAQGKYDAAVEVVKTKLRSEPAYQAALLSKERDAQQLAAIQSKNPAPSIDRTAPAATAKLDAAETITRMESAAIQADPQASAAKSDLDAAIAHRDEIGRAVDATVPRPALNPAR